MAEFVRAQIFGTTFEITSRYSDLQPVGMGAFGLVCSARDQLTNQNVAVKKIMKPFSTPVLAKRTYRELKLLKHLRHENVISLSDIFISPLEDIYFVTELLGTDLHRLLTSRPLEKQFIQYFLYQIMRGLKYVHSAGVVHRDLKPSNILVNENCDLKICDFGLARIQDPQMTGYEFIRLQFEEYILSLISSFKYHKHLQANQHNPRALLPHIDGDPVLDFGADFIDAWQRTENHRMWNTHTDSHLFDVVEPKHPCAGGLTIDDVQRRIAQQVQDMHLDERFAVDREALGRNLAAGREKASTMFNKFYADMESYREAQRAKVEEQAAAAQSASANAAAAEKNGVTDHDASLAGGGGAKSTTYMLEGKPLFPGKDHVNQFSIITELLGTPPDDVINGIASENTLRFVKSLPKRERQPLKNKFKNADPSAIDLLEKMLVFDPKKRITATEALSHDYLSPYHDPTDEPVAEEKFDWSFNDADLPVDTWKIMMYSEILDYHNVDANVAQLEEQLNAQTAQQ
ncbi:hypothetical protein BN1723_003275 [Verticillium longisporum]|uniref:Mitogen-activated protein kinase n=1 Tax=Verticillium longisporum TaxID=100787 RepID=A0A0G4LTU7_VERLO|nr:hypothetical protein BN1723_003275 [Verticillium longisporum]